MEFNDWFNPPTPARVGVQQNEISFKCSEVPIDGSLVFLTGEVVEAQKYQSTQLNSKQELLTRLQFELEQALKVYDEAELDLKSLNRKLYLMQDSSLTLKKNCSELQTDIVSILKEKQCLHNKLLESKWSQCRSVKEFQIYTEKMESFKKNMDLYFENNEIHKQIKILHSQILENKQTVKVLSNEEQFLSKDEVTEAVRLKDEVTEAVRDLKEQEKDVEHSQKNMCNLKEQTILLRKEVDAINKRNAAQLSRLKHHLEEKKNRCSALKVEIASLERKLKELEKS
ncbi:early endosome antigen 1 isoform X2 [Hydra vulgaris]|uniref:early endosome antigen 1 isoform X2 n=1 Tax=Hydra vulgaris TaxID=6087 RepID=UPI001F5F1A64|nr:early endosome antigen 1-like isoform X2 [Hydra vulgaris]